MSTKNLAREVESIALALSEENGYEYYHIDDELRELAKDVSDMQAENAKLRERVDELEGLTDGKRYIPQEWYQLATNENAKLRELVSRAWGLFLKHGAVHPCDLLEVDAVRDEMRELGIEVN